MSDARIAFVLASAIASGTERRMAFVYRHLTKRHPGRYTMAITPQLFSVLNHGGYGLDRLPGVHLLPEGTWLDRKRSSDVGFMTNLARLMTLGRYRREMIRMAQVGEVDAFQIYLEMVPFLALFPLPKSRVITSVVTHLPKYFDRRRAACHLMLRSTRRAFKVDCVYSHIAAELARIGVDPGKLNYPFRNTCNHEAFHPEPKELAVSFTARALRFKNPHVMLGVVGKLLSAHPAVRVFLHGGGPMRRTLAREVALRGWTEQVIIGYTPDPSIVVNRSLVHVSIEEFDNSPNQSLLEGMAAGCAIVASDVGLTREVVTPDVGRLTSLEPDEIANAILDLLDRPEEARAMGREGRQRILRDHHIDRYLEYMDGLHDLDDPRPIVAGARGEDPRGITPRWNDGSRAPSPTKAGVG